MVKKSGKRDGKKSFSKKDDNKSFSKKDDNKSSTYRGDKKTYSKKGYVKPVSEKSKAETENREKNKALKKTDGDRLNKYIANSGVCSRREADKYIEAGLVSINGKVVTELGTKVFYGDKVRVNDAGISPEKKTYVLLNKPKDYVTDDDNPHAQKTVNDLIQNGCKERVFPVGRLDKATTGLLLMTNDGELAEHLAHPKNNKKKIYQVTLNKEATLDDLQKLLEGVTLEDGKAKVDQISYCTPDDKKEVGIEIHTGKNRIIRRMFEHVGYKIKKLDRVYFAGLTKKNLPRGKWRFLSEKEIIMLKRGAYK